MIIYKFLLIFIDWLENWICVLDGLMNILVWVDSVLLIGEVFNVKVCRVGFLSLCIIFVF